MVAERWVLLGAAGTLAKILAIYSVEGSVGEILGS